MPNLASIMHKFYFCSLSQIFFLYQLLFFFSFVFFCYFTTLFMCNILWCYICLFLGKGKTIQTSTKLGHLVVLLCLLWWRAAEITNTSWWIHLTFCILLFLFFSFALTLWWLWACFTSPLQISSSSVHVPFNFSPLFQLINILFMYGLT